MFGLFAIGIFSVFAFSGIFGNKEKSGSKSEGGFGSKILSFLGAKSLSDLFSVSGNTAVGSLKDDDKDNKDDKKDSDVDFNKSLALIQQQMDNEKDENKKTQLEKDYNEMLSCVYDEKGNKLSQEQIQKNLESKPEFKKNLEKQSLIAAKDEKTTNKFKENVSKIDEIQAIKAGEKAVITHLDAVKRKKLEDAKDDEEQKKRITAEYDELISTHKSNISSIEKTAKEIEKLNEEKTALNAKDAVKKEIEKCDKINWEKSDVSAGDLTREVGEDGEGKEKKEAAEEFLRSKGVNPEVYKKYESVKSTLKEGEKIEDNEDLKKVAEEAVKKKKEEIDKKISDKNKELKNTVNQQKPKEEPEKKEENSFEDEDGYVYKKDGDKYTMTDDKGQEIEIDKEDFEKAKEKAVDDKKEGDERTDNDDDLEDDEVDDKGNSKKDPRKIYKRRTYKRGDKTFKTKSYYDKKGNSISAKDFKEKVANFKKSKKQKDENFNISNFLKDKLIVERFYPCDITNYLREHLR